MEIKVDIKGSNKIKELPKNLNLLAKSVKGKVNKSTEKHANNIATAIRDKIRLFAFSDKTEEQHIIVRKKVNKNGESISIESLRPYSNELEFGVKKHMVLTKYNPKFKRWVEDVYLKNHPDEKRFKKVRQPSQKRLKRKSSWEVISKKPDKLLIPGALWVGSGKHTRVRLHDSKDEFFYNTIEEYVRKSNTRSKYIADIKKAMKEFRKNTR